MALEKNLKSSQAGPPLEPKDKCGLKRSENARRADSGSSALIMKYSIIEQVLNGNG